VYPSKSVGKLVNWTGATSQDGGDVLAMWMIAHQKQCSYSLADEVMTGNCLRDIQACLQAYQVQLIFNFQPV
jgi:hypothetical protein